MLNHKPLHPINNKMSKVEAGREARHRNKVQDLRYTDKYLQGKPMPGNYTTCHTAHIEDRTEEDKEQRKADKGGDIQERRIISKDLAPALTKEEQREEAKQDKIYQKPNAAVKEDKKPKDRDLVPHKMVGEEQRRNNRHKRVEGSDLDGEGRGWESKARDHLKPTRAPEKPWSRMYTDRRGPTQDRHHSLVNNNDHTRHTEEAEVKGTRAEDDIQAFPEVFSRHGVPRRHHSDNDAAINGKDSHMPQKYLTNKGNKHVTNKGAEDRGAEDGAGGDLHAVRHQGPGA